MAQQSHHAIDMQGLAQMAPADVSAALGWLVMAGVDCAVEGSPRNWLAPVARAPEPVRSAAMARPIALVKADNLPGARIDAPTLDALSEALAGFAHPLRRTDIAPCLLSGNADSGVTILCEQPEAAGSPAAVLREKMLAAIGLDASNSALLHRLPWPTTGGRTPRGDELAAFAPFVARALELTRPRLLLALGQTAAALAGDGMALGSARGRWADVAVGDTAVPLLATCHPRLLLTQPLRKREAWADLQAFAARINHLP